MEQVDAALAASLGWRSAAMAAVSQRGDDWVLWRRFVRDRASADRQALIERYGQQAKAVAARLFASRVDSGMEFSDYHHFALIGLIECIDRFDPERGIRFESFAAARLRGAVLDGVESLSEKQRQVAARQQIIRDRTARAAEDVAAHPTTDVLERIAEVAMGLALGFMLDDCAMYLDEASEPAAADTAYQAAEARSVRSMLLSALETLGERERRILKLHYLQGVPFIDIAAQLQLTKGRISQIHHAALRSLRQALNDRSITAGHCL